MPAQEKLVIHGLPEQFELVIQCEIDPYSNTALEGLYESNGMLCTQCEAQGFRRIMFFIDRPDNMAVFTTHIEANSKRFPILLANGNKVSEQSLVNDRVRVSWHDPYPKSCYLFAAVAGKLALKKSQFTTVSGRKVAIEFYAESADHNKLNFAIAALKKSMAWDEQRYGCEYDLDIYMVVAVSHFNMGAMENKGLNIFNSRCVLASPDTATDNQYVSVESIIAHEYFHNWSGNRVTCRDWFQLSLKEGFTVFRDQQFSMEVDQSLKHRIDAVKVIRTAQFAQDASPMAHPIRPREYIEINNFYTVTVYDKGAEVVRMLHTILGPKAFRAGTNRYFATFDGQAVTTEDFLAAVAQDSSLDQTLFKHWYDYAHTPELEIVFSANTKERTVTLEFAQQHVSEQPFIIPVRFGLVSDNEQAVLLHSEHPGLRLDSNRTEGVFLLTQATDTLVLRGVNHSVVPSLLRGFSAPVIVRTNLTQAALARLVCADPDHFNRWDSAQTLWIRALLDCQDTLYDAWLTTLMNQRLDPQTRALICECMDVNSLMEVQAQRKQPIDIDAILASRTQLMQSYSDKAQAQLWQVLEQCQQALQQAFEPSAQQRGWRALRAIVLKYLAVEPNPQIEAVLLALLRNSDNLTDRLTALQLLVHEGFDSAQIGLDEFEQAWRHEPLAMDGWFRIQASDPRAEVFTRIEQLQQHACFDEKSPNHVRAVIGAFSQQNFGQFHDMSGVGYALLQQWVLAYNQSNPQLAARLVSPLINWARFDQQRQTRMADVLRAMLQTNKLAPDLYEIIVKSLQAKE